MNEKNYSFIPPKPAVTPETPFTSPQEYISSAGMNLKDVIVERKMAEILPWEESDVKEKNKVGFALRLPEPYYLKIKWLAGQRQFKHDSMMKVIESILYPGLDKAVEKLLKNQDSELK